MPYVMTRQLNVHPVNRSITYFIHETSFILCYLFLFPFFKFGSFCILKEIEIYVFSFSLLVHFDIIWFHLLQVDVRETTRKNISYSDTIFKTDYYLYSIDSFSNTLLRLRPYVFYDISFFRFLDTPCT